MPPAMPAVPAMTPALIPVVLSMLLRCWLYYLQQSVALCCTHVHNASEAWHTESSPHAVLVQLGIESTDWGLKSAIR